VAGGSTALSASTVPDGVGSGAGRRAAGRRAGVGCGVAACVELFVLCAEAAETAHDRASAAAMNKFLNMNTPVIKTAQI
jgi:hypothetical protein